MNPFDSVLQTIFSSDFGHWDVPTCVKRARRSAELVEHGWVDEDQFHDFAVRNAVRFHTAGNPDFFQGITVADEARRVREAGTSHDVANA